jgi:hypothetical protein
MLAENRIGGPASAGTQTPAPPRNLAELLHDLGMVLRWRMSHAAGSVHLPPSLESLRWESLLALRFVNLRASIQLRAMVEDWPLPRIQEAVQSAALETPRPQTGSPGPAEPRTVAHPEEKRADDQRPGSVIWLAVCGIAIGLATGIMGGLR